MRWPFNSQKSLNDSQENKSYLKSFEVYAQDIADEMTKNFGKGGEGYIFAISAKWGAGKTKLLTLVEPILTEQGFEVITFSAWQYTQDAETLRRAFLKALDSKLKWGWQDLFRSRKKFLNRLDFEETRTVLPRLAPGYALVAFIIILLVAVIQPALYVVIYHRLQSVLASIKNNPAITYLVTGVLAILALPQVLHIQRKSNRITSVDDFEMLFDQITKGHPRLIIFIDDLDRCTPEGAKLVLDTLKTFFRKKQVGYIVTGDHTVLERYMGDQLGVETTYIKDSGSINYSETSTRKRVEGRRFMQKIFDVYWKLPPLEPTEVGTLISINLDRVDGLTETDKEVVSALLTLYLDKTPREIERFATMLGFSLKSTRTRLKHLAEGGDDAGTKQLEVNLNAVNHRPGLLAKVLLMQEKFDVAYDYFAHSPQSYGEFERAALRTEYTNPEVDSITASLRSLLDAVEFEEFVRFVKTAPTFHNPTGSVKLVSPELFFYYSGFAGASPSGLLSEDFLARYVSADENLQNDFKSTSPDEVREATLVSGIENLENLKTPDLLINAITNLLNLFKLDNATYQNELIRLIQSKAIIPLWATFSDDQRNAMLDDSIHLAVQFNDEATLDYLFSEAPWKSYATTFLQHLSLPEMDDNLLTIVIDNVSSDPLDPIYEQFKRQFLEQNFDVIADAHGRSEEAIKRSLDRLASMEQRFEFRSIATDSMFNRTTEALIKLPGDQGEKAKLLLSFLNRSNKIWENIPQPSSRLLFKKKSKLHSRYGEEATKVFESWKNHS